MRLTLLLSLISLTGLLHPVVAQETSLTGKWKIVLVDAGAQFDFKKDTIIVPPAVKSGWKDASDSSMTMGIIKMLAEEMATGAYVFRADGTYQEMKGERVLRAGTYKTEKHNAVDMLTLAYTNKIGVETKEYLQYSFEQSDLKMVLQEGENKLTMLLEKSK